MYLIEATRELIDNFIMSDADQKEQVASCNEYVFENPSEYDAIIDDDNVLALGGVTDFGTIWLLTSYHVKKLGVSKQRKFVKLIRKQIENYMRHNRHRAFLFNTVWEKNVDHIKFIESCGGFLLPEKAYKTPIGETFIPFIIPNSYHEGGN